VRRRPHGRPPASRLHDAPPHLSFRGLTRERLGRVRTATAAARAAWVRDVLHARAPESSPSRRGTAPRRRRGSRSTPQRPSVPARCAGSRPRAAGPRVELRAQMRAHRTAAAAVEAAAGDARRAAQRQARLAAAAAVAAARSRCPTCPPSSNLLRVGQPHVPAAPPAKAPRRWERPPPSSLGAAGPRVAWEGWYAPLSAARADPPPVSALHAASRPRRVSDGGWRPRAGAPRATAKGPRSAQRGRARGCVRGPQSSRVRSRRTRSSAPSTSRARVRGRGGAVADDGCGVTLRSFGARRWLPGAAGLRAWRRGSRGGRLCAARCARRRSVPGGPREHSARYAYAHLKL